MPATITKKTVFLSATSVDLQDYVLALKVHLETSGYTVLHMVHFGAQPEDAVQVSLAELESANYLVGVYGRRYGHVPPDCEKSITEQEYHQARRLKLPVFAFLVDERNTGLLPGTGEDDGSPEAQAKQEKLRLFKNAISTAHVRETFDSITDLKEKVGASLSRYEKRPTILQPPVDSLRLELDDMVRLFHNDEELSSHPAEPAASLEHGLAEYRQMRRLPPAFTTRTQGQSSALGQDLATEKIGEALGAMLFPTASAAKVRNVLEDWQQQGAKGQVAITATERWQHLPLETLRLPALAAPLALTPQTDFFRRLGQKPFDACPDIAGPMKILMAVAAPWQSENAILDYEQELGRVMDIVENLPDFSPEQKSRQPIVHILDQGTLAAITEACTLNHYHVLHISAHGEPGALFLENGNGASHQVTAEEFVRRFPVGRQPLLTFLGACHTGAAGELAGFAQYLLDHGFAYVVAMQEAVSDRYATLFAERLYRHLAYAERPVPEDAFTLAKTWLEAERKESNRKLPPESQIPAEWMVPALYKANLMRHCLYEPDVNRFERQMEMPKEEFAPEIAHRAIGQFVGRRRELWRLKQKVLAKTGGAACITGMGGVGKSTLSSRALADRIRSGAKFTVLTVVGSLVLDTVFKKFGCTTQELQHQWAEFFETLLPSKGRDTVFLFDNFEENLKRQDNTVPLTGQDRLAEVADPMTAAFLSQLLASNQTRILITCRYPFALPGNMHRAFEAISLDALSPAETRKLISRLEGLKELPPAEKQQVSRTLGGHPRTLEFLDAILRDGHFTYPDVQRRLLPRLPPESLDQLQGRETLSESLKVAVAVSARDCFLDQLLELLNDGERQLLYLVSVFESPRPLTTLAWLAEKEGIRQEAKKMATRLLTLSLLSQAEEGYLVHRWAAEYLGEKMGEEQRRQAHCLAGACLLEQKPIPLDDGLAAWRHFLTGEDLEMAHQVAVVLEDRLNIWGHWELRAMVIDTMLGRTTTLPALQAEWLHLSGILKQQQGEYDEALALNRQCLAICEKLGDQSGMTTSYHQMGNIRYLQGEHDEALALNRQCLGIFEKLGDQHGMAGSYHQMGIIRQEQGEYDEALALYQQSLAIFEKFGDQSGMAGSYHQMGIIRQEQGEYDEALALNRQCLAIFEKLGDQHGMACFYHQMGNIRCRQGEYDEALALNRQCLAIFKKLGDQCGMAGSCHQMGIIRQRQGEYDEAMVLYQQSLAIKEKVGDQSGMAGSYHQMGNIRYLQGEYDEAMALYQQSLAIEEKLGNPGGMADSFGQMGNLLAAQGRDQEAFFCSLKAFSLFHRLRAPAVGQALNELRKTAGRNPAQWQGWLAAGVADPSSRQQLQDLISQESEAADDKAAQAVALISELKKMYLTMGETAFLAHMKEQTGQEMPAEILQLLKQV